MLERHSAPACRCKTQAKSLSRNLFANAKFKGREDARLAARSVNRYELLGAVSAAIIALDLVRHPQHMSTMNVVCPVMAFRAVEVGGGERLERFERGVFL
jgi:hypothetical protein